MDAPNPGNAPNISDNANGVPYGFTVSLSGKYVAPWRVMQDLEYLNNNSALTAVLGTMPRCTLDSDDIFA